MKIENKNKNRKLIEGLKEVESGGGEITIL